MDTELKKKWVAALRSGEYPQGRLAFKNAGGYCCLGVLNEVGRLGYGDAAGFFMGKSGEAACGIPESRQALLYSMNDEGKSFAEIADYIEANL